jgi:hypothetical protein
MALDDLLRGLLVLVAECKTKIGDALQIEDRGYFLRTKHNTLGPRCHAAPAVPALANPFISIVGSSADG